MRKTLALAVATPLLAMPVAAYADTPGCASVYERSQASIGMRMVKVHNIFDTSGEFIRQDTIGDYRYQHRQYDTCETPPGVIVYTYRKPVEGGYWRLYIKD